MHSVIEFPEVDFFFIKEQNMVLLELINLTDEDFAFFSKKIEEDAKKEILFENNYLILHFIKEARKFAFNISESDVKLMYEDGVLLGFSFRKNEGEVCEQVAIFTNKIKAT